MFTFVAQLAFTRNWRDRCVHCGYNALLKYDDEISIFRPCGHVICNEPCLANLLNQHSVNNIKNEDLEIDVNYNINCPDCATSIHKVMCLDDLHVKGDMKKLVPGIVSRIYTELQL